MTPEPPFSEAQRARYVEVLRKTGNKSVSARAIGHGPAFITRYRISDTTFDDACKEAEQEAADALEDAARERAVEGVVREKYIGPAEGGKFIEEYQYSDAILIRLLEANKPEKFAHRNKTDLSNPDGSLTPALNDTELATRLASLLALAAARAADKTGLL
jgi:hypothetical protein